jgi:hypothetical protein
MPQSSQLVDITHRTINPRVWTDPEIYRKEQERVFRRSWLYVGHDSQILRPGDFITNYMGEEPVLVWRGKQGEIRVFLNSCRHRCMRLCRVDDVMIRGLGASGLIEMDDAEVWAGCQETLRGAFHQERKIKPPTGLPSNPLGP